VILIIRTIDREAPLDWRKRARWPKSRDFTPPARNFLGETLANLERSGAWGSLGSIVVVDSGSPDPRGHLERSAPESFPWSIVTLDAPAKESTRTHNQNGARAARLAADSGEEWCLVIEDDLDFCDDFAESVMAWLADHAEAGPVCCFGSTWPPVREAELAGGCVADIPVRQFYGAQCLAVHSSQAEGLARYLEAHPTYQWETGEVTRCHDLLIARWLESEGVQSVRASAPSFVQHIGRGSTFDNRFFEFPSWPGREWSYQGRRAA
jgi:hypothetical protein